MVDFDPSVCILDYTDGNYLFIVPGSACQDGSCTWSLQDAPYLNLPANKYGSSSQYICDDTQRNLDWPDYSFKNGEPVVNDELSENRYMCKCGGPIDVPKDPTTGGDACGERCVRPWQAEFGKRCNLVAKTPARRGNYPGAGRLSPVGATQGVCLPMAASYLHASSGVREYIDEIGITYNCTGQATDEGVNENLCSCDGALPESVFGRTLTERDPCGLDKKADKTWIAGAVVGGVAALVMIGVLGLLFVRRRRRRTAKAELNEQTAQEIELQDVQRPTAIKVASQDSVAQRSTVSSQDSGVALLADRGGKGGKAET